MNRLLAGVAALTALIAAPAAIAQMSEPGERPGSAPLAMSFAPPPGAARIRNPGPEMFRGEAGFALSSRSYAETDGSRTVQNGLIGTWPITGALEAGVGLFSVGGEGRKQNEFKRSWTVKEVTPKSSTIAAVGMKLRF